MENTAAERTRQTLNMLDNSALPWQTKAKAVFNLHCYLAEQNVKEYPGGRMWSTYKTADALNISRERVNEDVRLCIYMRDFGTFFKGYTKKRALAHLRSEGK